MKAIKNKTSLFIIISFLLIFMESCVDDNEFNELDSYNDMVPWEGSKDLTNADVFSSDSLSLTYHGMYADNTTTGANGLYNPERGLRLETSVDVAKRVNVWNPTGYPDITSYLQYETDRYASDSISLVQCYFYLDGFIGKTIPREAFEAMDIYFDKLRELGQKAVLRFAYDRDFPNPTSIGPTEADILTHINQLTPFLARNLDVIQVVQAGFIGAWGEWNSSVHGLNQSDEIKRNILKNVLAMVPKRMVQVRVPEFKNLISKGDPDYKRVSFHDDYVVIKPHPWTGGMEEGTANFAQIENESPYLLVDGEMPWGYWSLSQTGSPPERGWIVDGPEVARKLFLQHFTSFSAIHNYKEDGPENYSMAYWKTTPITEDYLKQNHMPVSDNYFKNKDGSKAERNAFQYIRDHLGYRLELQQVDLTARNEPVKTIFADISLINRGFSTIFNEHPIYVTLINENGQVVEFLTNTNINDFQPYKPGDNSYTPLTHHIGGFITVSEKTPPGKYKLGLWIPDGSDRLKYNYRYAIRCANENSEWWVSPDKRYGINILTEIEIL